jgi:hypothetical protein
MRAPFSACVWDGRTHTNLLQLLACNCCSFLRWLLVKGGPLLSDMDGILKVCSVVRHQHHL